MLSGSAHCALSPRRLIGIVAALIALGVPLSSASAAESQPSGVRVFNGDNKTVALFTSAKCKLGRTGFIAAGYEQRLGALYQVRHFTGFHKYELRRGVYTGAFIEVRSPSLTYFASDFIPPYHIPGGGQISFANGGKLVGGGFYPMFNEAGTDGVGVTGGVTVSLPQEEDSSLKGRRGSASLLTQSSSLRRARLDELRRGAVNQQRDGRTGRSEPPKGQGREMRILSPRG